MEFIGELSGDRPRDVTYQWTLADEGKILEGQGTLRLKVQTPKKAESNLTATLTVQGLPIGCTSSASVTAPVVCWCDPLLVDEFGPLRRREHIARIDTAVVELRKRPQSKLLFIEYFPRKTARLTVNARLRWLTDQLDRRNRVPTRDFEIIASDSLDSVRRTKIYIVAPGAENPVP